MPDSSIHWENILSLLIVLILVCALFHSLWKASARKKPATDRIPGGVDGELLLVAGVAYFWGLYNLLAGSLLVGNLRILSAIQPSMVTVSLWVSAGLTLLSGLLLIYACLRLFFGRTVRVRQESAMIFILGGGAVEFITRLMEWRQSPTGENFIDTMSIGIGALIVGIVMMQILCKSERARNTYGCCQREQRRLQKDVSSCSL